MPKEELAASGSGHLLLTDFDDEDNAEESMVELSNQQAGGTRRRLFMKELRCTLYGYGDDQNPYTETVEFLDDLVLEFITDFTKKAMEIGRSGRVQVRSVGIGSLLLKKHFHDTCFYFLIQVEDIIFLVRSTPKMYARVRDLLTMNEELKKARKAFDEIKYVQGAT